MATKRTKKAPAVPVPAEPAAEPLPLRLEYIDPADLRENPKNWRLHSTAQTTALADAIQEVGWAGALLFNERTQNLIDGHARKSLFAGKGKVPVLVGSWDEATERKILATLDPIGALATADTAKLDALLREVSTGSEALSAMLAELATAAGVIPPETANGTPDPEPQVNRADELQKEWKTERGQLWVIPSKATVGKSHRLLCGDSTDAEDVARVMGGEKVGAVISDPPYGMDWDADASRFTGGKFGNHPRGRERDNVINDDRPFDPTPFLGFKTVVLWGMNHFCGKLPPGGTLVWIKKPDDRFGTFLSDCELAWTNVGHGVYAFRHEWGGITRESERGEFLHPTQKPAALIAWCIEKSKVNVGEVIFDPYIGSGTTLLAAEQTSRLCYGVEISPAYTAVALQRLADAGLAPALHSP
jgi:hypothetical protein